MATWNGHYTSDGDSDECDDTGELHFCCLKVPLFGGWALVALIALMLLELESDG